LCWQADGWTGIEEELELAGFVEVARVFSVFVLVLGNFVFTQTVVAIILLNIDHATNKFKASPTRTGFLRRITVHSSGASENWL